MPTSTQRFRLVGEDDASRAFLQVAAAAKLLNSNMSDVGSAALGLTKLMGGAGLIPVAAGAAAAITELGTALGAAAGAGGIFGLSVAGTVKGMVKSQQAIKVTEKSLSGLTKGTKAYHDAAVKLHAQQAAFQSDYGKAAKGYDSMTASWTKFLHATGPVTQGVLGKGFQLVADVLPKLVPVSNAAGKAVGGLIDDLSNWTKGPGFASLLHFLETSGPKDITAFGHIVGNTLSGLGGILSNFVGPGDHAAHTLEDLTKKFAAWGHSKGVSDSVNSFLKYVSDNGPQISSVFKSLAKAVPKMAEAFGKIGSANLTVTSKFLSLVAGLPQKQFNLIADGLFAIAAGSKAIAVVNGLAGAGGAIGSILKNKGIIGKAAGAAGGALGVQKVFVVNMAEGGLGGGGGILKTGEKVAGGGLLATAVPLAAAAVAAGALAYIAIKVQGGPAKPTSPGYRNSPGGMSPEATRRFNDQRISSNFASQSDFKSVGTALDSVRAKAGKASQAIEQIGPRAKDTAKAAVAAITALAGHGTALDSVKAKGAQASQALDMIGPHAKATSATAVTAISNVVSVLAHIKDKSLKVTADTSQAMTNLRVMQYAVDQLHGKTIVIRTTGGHVTDSSQVGGGSGGGAAGSSSGGGASTGKSFDARSGQAAGVDYMTGLLKGIASKSMSVQAAISKVANALSSIKGKVGNLQGVRAGFRSTFGSDSIFGQDFSHTGPSGATINGVAPSGPDVTTPGSIADVIAFQKAQRDKARTLNADVKKVTSMGLSKALIRQLRSQGAAGAATLHALAQGTPAQIRQLNALNKQTSQSLAQAGMRAGNYDRGGSIAADIRSAKKTEHALTLLEHRLKDLDHTLKKGQTINVVIDGEAIVTAIVRRNHRKGVKSAGV